MSEDVEALRAELEAKREAVGHLQEIITELVWQGREHGYMDDTDVRHWEREVHAAVFRDPALLEPGGDAVYEAEQHLRTRRLGDTD